MLPLSNDYAYEASSQLLNMKNLRTLLTVALVISSGYCLVENVSPPSGSMIADFEGASNTTLMCDVFVNSGSLQITTQWFLEDFGGNTGLQTLPQDASLFLLTGDLRPGDPSVTFNNHLVLLNLTSSLDRVTLYCGTGQNPRQANFTLIIYRMPILINGLQVTVLEGEDLIVDGLEEQPAAYPFPIFQWTRNGIPVVNISESVSYGYPSINFYNISRTAAGNYSLFAENYVINSTGTSIMVGNDMGSFTLDVFYGPELMEPLSNTFTTLQQSSITLICGVSVVGNPFPVVQWFSNTGDEISPSDGNFSINNGPDVVSLTIVDPSQADNGTWNCVFTLFAPNGTALKQLERTVSLVVVVAPSEPVNITVISHGATWITVSWLEPTFSGIPEFATFIVEAEPTNTRNSNRLAMIPPHSVTVIVSKDMLYANVTGVFPGEEYRLSARAVSESNGVQACSDSSRPVTVITHTTAPEVLCFVAPKSADGRVNITWDYSHTGGLNLTQLAIDYRQKEAESTFQTAPKDNIIISELEKKSFEILNITAGYTYTFRISATNNDGSTSMECPSVLHTVGIPQQALIHNAISPSPGIALLNVSTREAGVTDGEAFEFIVQANVINDGTSQFFVQEVINYVDSSAISLIVSGLLPGIEYQFSVKVKNKFGASEFSSLSALSIQESVPQDQISIATVVGGMVAGVILLVLAVLIIVVVVIFLSCRKSYLTNLEKNKFSSEESDMTENNLYKTTHVADMENQDDSHYTAIPAFSSSRPQSDVYYDSLTTSTPSHNVKQSDNPLYSSTQELRISAAYDVPSRARSLTPSAFEMIPPVLPNTDHASTSDHTTPKGNNTFNNRLSYGLELELSNREIPPICHKRSLSQTAEPVYTEL